MNDFELKKLEDLVKRVKVGFVGSINKFYCEKDEGIPIIRTTDLTQNGVDYSSLKYITKEFHLKNTKSQVRKNDLIIARHGDNGKANIHKKDFEAQVLNAVIIEPNNQLLRPYLLKLFFDSPFVKKQILGQVKGSVQGVINTSHVANILIPFNEKINYHGLEKLIYAIDAKIEVNNKINAELEAMAKLVYDYWFVQFDFPNAEGKPYKSSGGKMVYNEVLKREVPEGWTSGELKDIADITMGQSPSGSSYNEDGEGTIFYQGATDFGLRFPTIRKYTTEPSRYAKQHDILMSVRAPVGTLNIAKEDCCIGRGLASLRSKKGVNSYVFEVMKDFKTIFDRRNSSGTTFGSITKNDLFSLKVVIPDDEVLKNYGKLSKVWDEKIFNNNEANQQLASLRDWLLPMLMNGQVRVE